MMLTDTENLHTLRDMIRWITSRFNQAHLFFGHGTDNALDEALALVLHVLHLDHSLPAEYLDSRLTPSEKSAILDLLRERIQTRKPLAHLTGTTSFAGLSFRITEDVLVPRSPIAELIQDSFHPWIDNESVNHVLDLCTGSGCIGIACAYAFPQADIVLSDLSEAAVAVARKNIQKHQLENRVRAVVADVWSGIPADTFDLIVSNPPYVSQDEYEKLPAEYHQEPAMGLVSGADGMDIVRQILAGAASRLSENGIIVIEVGASADLLMQLYPAVAFNWIEFENGGDGVFMLTRQQLVHYHNDFQEALSS